MGFCLQSGGVNYGHTAWLYLPRWPHILLGSLLSSKHCIPGESYSSRFENKNVKECTLWADGRAPFVWLQLDGMIVAPTDSESWGRGLLWWIEFTKLKGITIQGNGVIDGRGTGWWQQDNPFDYPIDDDFKLIVPLNNTVQERPPMPVIHPHFF